MNTILFLSLIFLLFMCICYIVVVVLCAVLVNGKPLAPTLLYKDRLQYTHERDDSGTLEGYLLIGTHGSAAYRITPDVLVDSRGVGSKQTFSWLTGLIRRWSLNQHYDIYSQLCLGARFLHLEIALHNEEWVTLHSYLCGGVAEDMSQVVRFIEEKDNKAFVLLNIQLFGVSEGATDKASRTIWTYLSELGGTHIWPMDIPVSKKTTILSLRGKIVVVKYSECRMYPSDYTTDNKTFDFNRSHTQIQTYLSENTKDDRLGCLQWVMTPDTMDLVHSALLPYPISGLYTLPVVVDNTRFRRLLDSLYQVQSGFQVLLVDHLMPSISREIEEWNTKRRQILACL